MPNSFQIIEGDALDALFNLEGMKDAAPVTA